MFNVLVMMTLFNEINARKIDGSTNVFTGLHRSRMFIVIWTTTFILQVKHLCNILHSSLLFTRSYPRRLRYALYPDGQSVRLSRACVHR